MAGSILIGCEQHRPQQSRPNEESKAATKQVPYVAVEMRSVRETIELPTTLIGYEEAQLMAKIAGYVKQVHVNIGDEIAEGDLLITLESPEYNHQVQKHEELLTEARADIDLVNAQSEATQAKLAEQEAMIDLRRSEHARVSALVSSGALTERKLEETDFALKSAEASMESHLKEVAVADARLRMATAHAQVVAADLQKARTMAAYQEIRAPFSGIVTNRHVDAGDFVEPATGDGAMPLVEIAIVDTLRAVVHVTMDDAGKVSVGRETEVRVVGAPDKVLQGTVSRTSGVFDKESRMMRAEIDLANPPDPATGQRALMAGSYGTATVIAQEAKLPAAPKSALQARGDKQTVTVVASDGTCLTTIVEIAVDGGDIVGITSGIKAGDRIVASEPAQVKNGDKLATDQMKLTTY